MIRYVEDIKAKECPRSIKSKVKIRTALIPLIRF